MTTLQAGSWAHKAQRTTKARDDSGLQDKARAALAIAIFIALLAAALAIRVLVYVHL